MTELYYPLRSLREGHWFKLICGASFQHLPAIRNLVLAYTLAGADCIDVAADPAVILSAKTALDIAAEISVNRCKHAFREQGRPLLMVSFNDGEDPHFRKAELSPARCPPSCDRPCESVCPAQAIVFQQTCDGPLADGSVADGGLSIDSDRCYGCGRCLPVCPSQQISARAYVSTPSAIAPLVLQSGVDAIEIHTQIGRLDDFRRLWQTIAPWVARLKLLAISCPDGEGLLSYLWALYELISPLPCPLIWQTDGRPMSGDIGVGTTKAAIKLGQKVLAQGPPGYVQLAGGTNHHTVPKLQTLGLLNRDRAQSETVPTAPHRAIAGIAYGSYARALLMPVLNQLETMAQPELSTTNPVGYRDFQRSIAHPADAAGRSERLENQTVATLPAIATGQLEAFPNLLWHAVELAHSLVDPLKRSGRNDLSSA